MSNLSYKESGIDERIIKAVAEMGYETMTPIQEQAMPIMAEGKDMIGLAQTGTGKTAAFGIPMLQMIDPDNRNVQAIVLCPTRELAMQTAEEVRKYSKYMHGIKAVSIYGGQDITRQIKALKSEVQIVIGTPGRVMDHMRRHTLKLNDVRLVVLDEADEMLNMGFREDIETILKDAPVERQTVLFSATMPQSILEIVGEYQKDDTVKVKIASKDITVDRIDQSYYQVGKNQKKEVTLRLLEFYNPARGLIFCNTKRMVDELAEFLKGMGFTAEGLHGDLSQNQRDTVMNLFRSGRATILIATDVAARGIDVDDVEAVINYDVPEDVEYYVHRIGRTGRAGKSGYAFTIVSGRDMYRLRDIERVCKIKIPEKKIPGATEVTTNKMNKVISNAKDLIDTNYPGKLEILLESRLMEEDISVLEFATALLKIQMGEDAKEIVIEKNDGYRRSSGGNRSGRSYGSYGGNRDGGRSYGGNRSGSKDGNRSGRSSGSKDGRSFGSRDGGRDGGYRGKDGQSANHEKRGGMSRNKSGYMMRKTKDQGSGRKAGLEE